MDLLARLAHPDLLVHLHLDRLDLLVQRAQQAALVQSDLRAHLARLARLARWDLLAKLEKTAMLATVVKLARPAALARLADLGFLVRLELQARLVPEVIKAIATSHTSQRRELWS